MKKGTERRGRKMTTKLIGYSERKTGTYEGREYDNINLQTICDSFDDISGWGCSVLKVKFPKLPQILGCEADKVYHVLDLMLNKEIVLDYVQTSRGANLCGIHLKKPV